MDSFYSRTSLYQLWGGNGIHVYNNLVIDSLGLYYKPLCE